MYEQYFSGWDVLPEFQTEYVCLWPHWLDKENYHLLDEVTELEWKRFNEFIEKISKHYKVGVINCTNETVIFPKIIRSTFSTYSESMNKDSLLFSKYILPELDCLITEEWDYTYIIWHKNNGAIDALSSHIRNSKLHHFTAKRYD